ncbi:MAG: hypothetical protein Q9187_003596 [Circinaria calcarea]
MPTLFQDRCGISLYDAQYSRGGRKGPIPKEIIQQVLAALKGFKRTCEDFGVSDVRVVATEATREAINSVDYRQAIEDATGWEVEMLAKEEEGKMGALGIASSFSGVRNLLLDLGGGSVQLSWVVTANGEAETPPRGAVSLPYGAAALSRLLVEVEGQGSQATQDLQQKITDQFRQAIYDLDIPSAVINAAKRENGLALYLSGGGFRGWGYILMASHPVQPYPIPLINGFCVPIASFLPNTDIQSTVDNSIFRISSRRASQVPAVSFLITSLVAALPAIATVYFAQGGLREGLLFSTLPPSIRSQHPLVTATAPFAPSSTEALVELLRSGIPAHETSGSPARWDLLCPEFLVDDAFLTSVIHLVNAHAPLPKDIRAAAALRSTTTGILANAHGLAHQERALLGLVLCERWGGELSSADSDFLEKMQQLVGANEAWWAKYIGRLAQGVGECYPAGMKGESRLRLQAKWESKGGAAVVVVKVAGYTGPWADDLAKLSKKKNQVKRQDGLKIELEVSTGPW